MNAQTEVGIVMLAINQFVDGSLFTLNRTKIPHHLFMESLSRLSLPYTIEGSFLWLYL